MRAEEEWRYYESVIFSQEYTKMPDFNGYKIIRSLKNDISDGGGIPTVESTRLCNGTILYKVGELKPTSKRVSLLDNYISSFKSKIPEGVQIVESQLFTKVEDDGRVLVELSVIYKQ